MIFKAAQAAGLVRKNPAIDPLEGVTPAVARARIISAAVVVAVATKVDAPYWGRVACDQRRWIFISEKTANLGAAANALADHLVQPELLPVAPLGSCRRQAKDGGGRLGKAMIAYAEGVVLESVGTLPEAIDRDDCVFSPKFMAAAWVTAWSAVAEAIQTVAEILRQIEVARIVSHYVSTEQAEKVMCALRPLGLDIFEPVSED